MSAVLHTARGIRRDDTSQAHAVTIDVRRGFVSVNGWPCGVADIEHLERLLGRAKAALIRQSAPAVSAEVLP